MKKSALLLALFLLSQVCFARVEARKDSRGWRLFDGEKEVEVKGITWSNNPIGVDYSYSLWTMGDEFIKNMIDYDMPLLTAMGVNAIRCFNDVPPKWVEYIYQNYGVYTIINHLMGRYGVTVKGVWQTKTDYSDPDTCEVLYAQLLETVETYKDVQGVIMYMLGNESNYGLEWSGSDIENLPVGEQHRAKAVYLYKMFNEAMRRAKEIDPDHPYGIVNGDVQYIDLIGELCPEMDIFGSNVYRGWKFYDAFYSDVETKLDKPCIITECGADAYNALTGVEDQYGQLQYYKSQWQEVYEEGYGKGRHGNILGCVVFEWVDEWWKYLQYTDLAVHNDNASWANAGYSLDYKEGSNNMNEEWFGICAQSLETTPEGINKRVPRAVYYFLQDVWTISLYHSTAQEVAQRFAQIRDTAYLDKSNEHGLRAAIKETKRIRIEAASVGVQATTPLHVNTLKDGGSWSDAIHYRNSLKGDNPDTYTNKPRVAAETELKVAFDPFTWLSGTTTIRAWSGEPISRLRDHSELYYTEYDLNKDEIKNGNPTVTASDRKKYFDLYSASLEYKNKYFNLAGFYHTGHASYEVFGDIFHLTQEAFDFSGYDFDGSKAPIGLEFVGHEAIDGLRIMAGPELWNGAKPMVLANYYRNLPVKGSAPAFAVGATGLIGFGEKPFSDEDPFNAYGYGNKLSLYGQMQWRNYLSAKLGVLYSGDEKLGAEYVTDSGDTKEITFADTLGAFLELGTDAIPHTNIYVDAIYRGLVAGTNPEQVRGGFFTGDTGGSNRFEIKAGATVGFGSFTIQPVFRWRTPLQKATGERSLIDGSPFTVDLSNRETLEVEAVLTYDTEGGSWFYAWDNADKEAAKLAISLAGHYVIFAGETDSLPYKTDLYKYNESRSSGVSKVYQYWGNADGLADQSGMWEVGLRLVANPFPEWRIIGNITAGRQNALTGMAEGDREYITFWGFGLATRYKHLIASTNFLFSGWGPASWFRNANNTFPLQYTVDVAYGFGKSAPSFLDDMNRVGLRVVGSVFDAHSADSYGALPASIGTDAKDIAGHHYMEITIYTKIGIK